MAGARGQRGAGTGRARAFGDARAEVSAAEFLRALESTSRGIRDPVAKLRYIRSSLSRQQRLDRLVQAVPWPTLRRALYRWLSLEGLRHLLTTNPNGAPTVRLAVGTRVGMLASRLVTAGAALAVAGAVAAAVFHRAPPQKDAPVLAAAPPAPAEVLPALPQGVAPAGVWLVEKGEGSEQYSNGLRIDTTATVVGDPRRYHVFHVPGGLDPKLETRPAGLLFHTTESDIWPLDASFNENLRDSSARLLRYLQRNRLYHYLIDRFGRVFRVVDEDSKANHAGNSVWSRDKDVYLNLNHAFLGVSFETRWEGGRALPITRAQLAAGRDLAEYLRARYEIPAEMCVTHGLTSVNPKKRLIGHHLDWARGFPFQAFGLPDQYAREAPSVALFGFGYDDGFMRVMGEPWPGVRAAENALAAEAARRGLSVDDVVKEKRELYDRWVQEQSREEDVRGTRTADGASR
jgi:N-acetylmuramoyl-L-alanine amidase